MPLRGSVEFQLSQRSRAILLDIEYFAKSLKVIQNNTIQYFAYEFLLALQ